MAKKINRRPYELVGFEYEDYVAWCKAHKQRVRDTTSKKKFFKLIYDFKLIKKDGKVIDFSEGE